LWGVLGVKISSQTTKGEWNIVSFPKYLTQTGPSERFIRKVMPSSEQDSTEGLLRLSEEETTPTGRQGPGTFLPGVEEAKRKRRRREKKIQYGKGKPHLGPF